MGMALPAPNGLGKTLRTNSRPCNVVLRPFRMFSLGQRVQPATMIGFKQIEFFDHTRRAYEREGDNLTPAFEAAKDEVLVFSNRTAYGTETSSSGTASGESFTLIVLPLAL